jgi:hypothetical protein
LCEIESWLRADEKKADDCMCGIYFQVHFPIYTQTIVYEKLDVIQ